MLSFKIITGDTRNDILHSLEKLSDMEYQCACEVIGELILDECDVEYAVTASFGCLLIRVFDMGRYLFLYPYELSDKADASSAISAVAEYAKREELPLVFVDVPGEELSRFCGFRHIDIDAEDSSCESYRVRVKTECELLSEIPRITRGRVTLNAISEADIGDYARLCRDKDLNKYWGYDYSEDVKSPTDAYFFESVAEEFARGVSMSMAIRTDGAFCGEAVIYAFDGRGSAEFGIRLLPEFHGKGLGVESAIATIEAAKEIGLITLRSKVLSQNLPSVAMLKRVADECTEENEYFQFTIYLN